MVGEDSERARGALVDVEVKTMEYGRTKNDSKQLSEETDLVQLAEGEEGQQTEYQTQETEKRRQAAALQKGWMVS